VSQFKVEFGSEEASNVDLNATWEILSLKLLTNQSACSHSYQSLTYWTYFVVNNDTTVNICNPQMMQCFICHPIHLEHIDTWGKHKRLLSYNKNHGASALKNHDCHEHLDLYKKWELFYCRSL